MDGAPARRIPLPRLALAVALGVSLLGLTYILFDPELGTPVPIFQEITCRGKMLVTASDGSDRPRLLMPETAVKMRAEFDGELRPAYFTLYTREGDDAWEEYYSTAVPAGEHFLYVAPITNETQVYISAKDMDGKRCGSASGVIGVPPANATAE